ncbi:MAG: serine/threonine-protein kinase [Planctomycetota bacterium]
MEDKTRLSIDAIVESYTEAWKSGTAVTIVDFLQRRGSNDQGCLESLVLADARLRVDAGERVSADVYLRQWPELAGTRCIEQVLQLASSDHTSSGSSGMTSDRNGVDEYEAGDRISQYEIIRSVGRGTHGCVYLALDLTLRRHVALKVSAASGVEGEALARLDHPNVVRVFAEQTIDGRKLLAMQFIPGCTLAELLGERPFERPDDWGRHRVCRWIEDQIPPGDKKTRAEAMDGEHAAQADRYHSLVVRWAVQLAWALKHAHLRGVLHRDIKPSNVMMDGQARPMLTDFNVARLETGLDATEFGGTLAYMAPEHLRAYQSVSEDLSGAVDARSDVYSLGILLLELLSGHKTWGGLPAEGERLVPALLAQRLGGIPDAFARGIRPRSLRVVLSMCLAAEPDRRYQSAGDLAVDLQAWLEGRPLVHAAGSSLSSRVIGFARRHPKSSVVAVVLIAAFIGGLLSASSLSQARVESSWENIERAKTALRVGDTTTASTLIGETREMIREPTFVLRKSSRLEITSQLELIEGEIRRSQFDTRADAVRLMFASSSPDETLNASKRLLEQFGVNGSDDWEADSPFAELDESSQQIISEGITEIMLMTLLRMQDAGRQTDIARLVNRLPRHHRRLPVFRSAFGDRSVTNEGTKESRDSFEAHLQGLVAFHQKRFDDAQVWFQRSASWRDENNRSRFWTAFWHARACEKVDRTGQAIALYGVCIGQRPGFTWPRYNLARLFAEDGQLKAAMHYIDSVIRLDQEFAPAYVLKSAILVKQERYQDALLACQEAVRYADASVDLYKNRAAAHAGLQQFQRAYEDLLHVDQIAPGDKQVESDLARIRGLIGTRSDRR